MSNEKIDDGLIPRTKRDTDEPAAAWRSLFWHWVAAPADGKVTYFRTATAYKLIDNNNGTGMLVLRTAGGAPDHVPVQLPNARQFIAELDAIEEQCALLLLQNDRVRSAMAESIEGQVKRLVGMSIEQTRQDAIKLVPALVNQAIDEIAKQTGTEEPEPKKAIQERGGKKR